MIILDNKLLASIPYSETELRLEIAAHLYQKKYLSFRQAQAFAEVDFWTFEAYLHQNQIYLPYDEDDFDADMKTIRQIQAIP